MAMRAIPPSTMQGELQNEKDIANSFDFGGAVLAYGTARAESSCLNQTSSGNPYGCFGNGNCVWWGWKMAKDNWGAPLPKWGDAKFWADGARDAGYSVNTTPKVNDLAVNTTVFSPAAGRVTGHVAYVQQVDSTYVYVSEMNYATGTINFMKRYPKTWFNWYIHPKPRPVINSISPDPKFWSWGDISYMVLTSFG